MTLNFAYCYIRLQNMRFLLPQQKLEIHTWPILHQNPAIPRCSQERSKTIRGSLFLLQKRKHGRQGASASSIYSSIPSCITSPTAPPSICAQRSHLCSTAKGLPEASVTIFSFHEGNFAPPRTIEDPPRVFKTLQGSSRPSKGLQDPPRVFKTLQGSSFLKEHSFFHSVLSTIKDHSRVFKTIRGSLRPFEGL